MEIKGSTLVLETPEEVAAFAVLTGLATPISIMPKDRSLPINVFYTHRDEAEDAAAGVNEQLNRYRE